MNPVYPLEAKVIRLYLDDLIDFEFFEKLRHIVHVYESEICSSEVSMEDIIE